MRKLPTEIFSEGVVVHTSEAMMQESSPQLSAALASLESSHVVIDLDELEHLDSHRLITLLDAQERLRELGGDLRIATGKAANRKLLDISRVSDRVEIFESVLDALQSFA
jgi:anti-sigma B factor antagonist